MAVVLLAVAPTLIAGATLTVGSATASASTTCPSTAPRGVRGSSWPRAQRRLAPRGPRMIELCRYAGINRRPNFGLVGSDLVSARTTIHRLVQRFDALKSPPPNQAFACPDDNGSQIVAMLRYRARREVQISITLSGCQTASDGSLKRAAFNFDGRNPQGPKLVAQLKRLTRS